MPEIVNENTNAAPTAPTTLTHNQAKVKPESVSPPLPRLAYSLRETAEILGISYISAFRLTQRGLLKSSSALRCKLIPASEIERFLTSTL
jgi:hypothetical protein